MTSETKTTAQSLFGALFARLDASLAAKTRRMNATGRAPLDHAPTRRALSQLSRAQMIDIGLDPTALEPSASLEVEAGLMTRLTSLR